MVQQIARLSEDPSEAFVRLLLQNAGLSHIRTKALSEYIELTKGAFREFVNLRILKRLDLPTKDTEINKVTVPEVVAANPSAPSNDGIITTDLEISIYYYVKRRLSYLIKNEELFDEIEKIEYRDYRGKFVIFYKKERAGRLLDFYENGKKKYKVDFGKDAGGEFDTDKLSEIDAALGSVFKKRVAELQGKGARGLEGAD